MSGAGQSGDVACKNSSVWPRPAAQVVAIALSAGGLAPLRRLMATLPWNLPAAVVIAQHMRGVSYLPGILRHHTKLRVVQAESGVLMQCGTAYVGPSDQHLIVTPDGRLQVADRPTLRFRPSADWLFESVAAAFAERTIVVVLSGRLSDAAGGAVRVNRAGGRVIVQAPDTCRFPEMPLAVLQAGAVHSVLQPEQMGARLSAIVNALDIRNDGHEWEHPFGTDIGPPAELPGTGTV